MRLAIAGPGDCGLRTPTTGKPVCCARAASGHAAVPASPAINVRRLIPTPVQRGGIIPAQASPLIGVEKFGGAVLQQVQAMSASLRALTSSRQTTLPSF